MGFKEAVMTCLNKYLTFSGRASRSEFWWFVLFYNLATVCGFILVMFTITPEGEGGLIWPLFTTMLFLLPPMASVTARRLHDKGLTAWVMLLFLFPFGGIAVLILCALPGDAGDNGYGEAQPNAQNEPVFQRSNIPNVKDRN